MDIKQKRVPLHHRNKKRKSEVIDRELVQEIQIIYDRHNKNNSDNFGISFSRYIDELARRIREASYVERMLGEMEGRVLLQLSRKERAILAKIKNLEDISPKKKGRGRKPEVRLMSITMTAMGVYWFATGKRPTFTVKDGRAYGECLDFLSRVFDILAVGLKGKNSQMQPSAEAQIRHLQETLKKWDAAYQVRQQEAGAVPRHICALDLIDGPFAYGLE